VVFRVTDSLTALRRDSEQLEDLGDWYRVASIEHKIATRVYAEGHPVAGAITVVPISTVNPGLPRVKPIQLAFDHWKICKPSNRTYQVYKGTMRFIQEVVQRAQKKKLNKPSKRRGTSPEIIVPKLELTLMDPKEARCVLPSGMDIETVLRQRIDAESERMGLQSLAWATDALEQYRANRKAALKSISDEIERWDFMRSETPSTALEHYALELLDWYKGVLMESSLRYSKEIDAIRSVSLCFQLANNGTLPAEGVEIELRVTPPSMVSLSRPSTDFVYSSKPAPVPPPEFGLPAPKDPKRPYISFYNISASGWPAGSSLDRDVFSAVDPNDGQQFLRATMANLQHGKGVKLRPFYIVFGARAAEDIRVQYKLFAKNQPTVGVGEVRITVCDQ
jgi:hypothetical protein